jgi:hypothetical protein
MRGLRSELTESGDGGDGLFWAITGTMPARDDTQSS